MREGMVIGGGKGGDSGGKRREGDNKRGREGMGGDRNGWEGLLIWLWGDARPWRQHSFKAQCKAKPLYTGKYDLLKNPPLSRKSTLITYYNFFEVQHLADSLTFVDRNSVSF